MKATYGFGKMIARGSFFRSLENKAIAYLQNPDKLVDLLRKTKQKAELAAGSGPLKDVWDSLASFLRLLRAYARREYTGIPTSHLILIVAAVLYFVIPIDVIPDFIIAFGFLDDAAVIAWVVKTVKDDLDAYRRWESVHAQAGEGV